MTHICSPFSTLYPYYSSLFSPCQWGLVEFCELCRYAQNFRGDIVFYDRFVYLCTQRGVSPSRAAVDAGISKSLVTKWKTNNVQDPSPDVLRKLAKYFNLSVSELLEEKDQKKMPILTEKDRRDIAKDLELMMQQLDAGGDLMFDGDPISDEARASIRNALQMGLEIAKVKNKERFTPRKYRKD